jgi:hypothetical protein
MKILVDIGHPAHVHYFRNAISHLKRAGNEVIITARDRTHIHDLLSHYELVFFNRGTGSNSFVGKLWYMLKADLRLFSISLKEKPDLYLSFSSPYAAQVAKMMGKPHVCLNDTEHTDRSHSIFTYPFSNVVVTPACYQNTLGRKHVKMNNVIEGLYLDDKYFHADKDIANSLRGPDSQGYVIIRFVSWEAHHDIGESGLTDEIKRELIRMLQKKYRVHVSTEGEMPNEFSELAIDIPIHKMHDALAGATMFVGESGTMASESAFLGTPAVYINSLPLMGYLKLEQEMGLLYHFKGSDHVIPHVKEMINDTELSSKAKSAAFQMRNGFIDGTDFLVKLVSSYSSDIQPTNDDG